MTIKKLKSATRNYGGKGMMFNDIIKHFPSSDEYDLYIEPFAGSYSIGLSLDPIPKTEIFNDLNKNVYALYRVLSDAEMYKAFKDKCDLVFYMEDLRKEAIYLLKTDDLDLIDRAFYFFYVNRTSHNGNGGFSKNTSVRRNMSKSISDFLSAIDRLPELHDRLSKVIVSNTNGVELIKKYNDNRTLIYADPPYEQSTRTSARYPVDMNREVQEDFINAVVNSNAKILISGYDCELYDALTSNGFKKIQFIVNTVDANFNQKTKVETLWKNY